MNVLQSMRATIASATVTGQIPVNQATAPGAIPDALGGPITADELRRAAEAVKAEEKDRNSLRQKLIVTGAKVLLTAAAGAGGQAVLHGATGAAIGKGVAAVGLSYATQDKKKMQCRQVHCHLQPAGAR